MMDNTRKRKIVRNFVIGYLLLQVLVIVLYLGFWAVHPGGFVVAENERMSPPPMLPDYLLLKMHRITKGLLYLII